MTTLGSRKYFACRMSKVIDGADWAKLRGAMRRRSTIRVISARSKGTSLPSGIYAIDALRRELYAARRPSKAGLALAELLIDALAQDDGLEALSGGLS